MDKPLKVVASSSEQQVLDILFPEDDGRVRATIRLDRIGHHLMLAALAEQIFTARLFAAAHLLRDALDPELLEAVAKEIDCHEHSARAHGLRSLAEKQRAALRTAEEGATDNTK